MKRVARNTVASEEFVQQRKALVAAERKLTALQRRITRAREKVAVLSDDLAARRAERQRQQSTATGRALSAATKKLETALGQRDSLLAEYREMKQLVRGQRALCRKLERKEEARQKAVAKFLKEWERNYDREIRMKEQNIERRRRQLRN
jgi:hypothetical protein